MIVNNKMSEIELENKNDKALKVQKFLIDAIEHQELQKGGYGSEPDYESIKKHIRKYKYYSCHEDAGLFFNSTHSLNIFIKKHDLYGSLDRLWIFDIQIHKICELDFKLCFSKFKIK